MNVSARNILVPVFSEGCFKVYFLFGGYLADNYLSRNHSEQVKLKFSKNLVKGLSMPLDSGNGIHFASHILQHNGEWLKGLG